jgi:hypothetical protein
MDLNRNHYLLIGMLALLLGIQFRAVDSFVLNESSTKFLAKQNARTEPATLWSLPISLASQGAVALPRKTIRLPRWLSWPLMTAGVVLVLQSLAMKKPGAK